MNTSKERIRQLYRDLQSGRASRFPLISDISEWVTLLELMQV